MSAPSGVLVGRGTAAAELGLIGRFWLVAKALFALLALVVLLRGTGFGHYRCGLGSAFRNLRQNGGRDFPALEDNAALALDALYFAAFGAGTKGGRGTFLSGAASAADAVHEIVRSLRKIEVDHVGDAIDVDAASGDVGCDQHAVTVFAEPGERLIALILSAVTMHGHGADARGGQALR